MTEVKHIRIKAQTTPGGLDGWRFNLIDIDTGRVLPVSADNRSTIEYNGFGNPIKATVVLFIDEIDIEAETTLIEVKK
jgi:hypothetical protein